jgi:ABC-type phosphate transport system substrate-binding protein
VKPLVPRSRPPRWLGRVAGCVLCLCHAAAQAEVVAVVAAASPIRALSHEQIADIFLGRSTRLPSGTVAVPLDLPEGSPERDEFYLRVAGKSPAQLKAFWSKLIFTGRGRPPKSVADSGEVLKYVRQNPAVIGYVDRAAVDSTVRVLR